MALPFGLTAGRAGGGDGRGGSGVAGRGEPAAGPFDPALAAAALTQAALRRQARAKFGADAETMFFTRDGLEQATRPAIADHHARRFVAAGVRRVIDLGCGIGSDALAFARAGLEVVAVERDPDTAAVAAANLAGRATVVCADAEQVAGDLLADGSAVYADPARRTERGRVWRLAELTPPWSFVTRLLDGRRSAGVKLGPALPHAEIPATAEAEWLSHRGDGGRGRAVGRSGSRPRRTRGPGLARRRPDAAARWRRRRPAGCRSGTSATTSTSRTGR